jgi:hypothetical protein
LPGSRQKNLGRSWTRRTSFWVGTAQKLKLQSKGSLFIYGRLEHLGKLRAFRMFRVSSDLTYQRRGNWDHERERIKVV